VQDIQLAIAEYMLAARDKPRKEVLQFCADKTLFAQPVFSPGTLATIAAHIIEICGDWKWL
jgi:hypothetical protein